jgi:hypothetical protein
MQNHDVASSIAAGRPRRLGIPIVAAGVALLTLAMLLDGRLDEDRLIPASALLLICLVALRGAARWGGIRKAMLVTTGSLAGGAFAMFTVAFVGRIVADAPSQIASPGAGFAAALVAIGVGAAVVPVAALLMTAALGRRNRSPSAPARTAAPGEGSEASRHLT